jgi:TP901-1 family phage major tail protein
MAGFNGRELTFDWDSTTLVGVRSRGVNMSNDMVDVTTDDDSGWRTLLATPGLKSVEVTLDGITSDEVLTAEFFNASTTGETMQCNLPSSLAVPGNLSGTFSLSGFEYSAAHDGALEFSATFMSSGAVTYTASAAS